ncbi:MAG: DUF1800 domain-containing protein [Paracoccaceae bacterium]|nr:DUF1800 domain-containing protein [Paracoccaceae bacterium]
MSAKPTIAAIRFGFGLSPSIAPPADASAIMAALLGPDPVAATYPVAPSTEVWPLAMTEVKLRRDAKLGNPDTMAQFNAAQRRNRIIAAQGFVNILQRAVQSPDGFRERLQNFWSGHFTVVAKQPVLMCLPTAFAEEALRPHLTGRFADMLKAVVTHPGMLAYLDQNSSIGPDSRVGLRRKLGLNENLGRELLELHTLGVGAGYTQTDVRQFAYLLTGLTFNPKQGQFRFNPAAAEPGAELVLGHRYGGEKPARLADIFAALEDIALRPETAHHITTKLAVHFVSDTPDAGLVTAMTAAYTHSKGFLPAVYEAMLNHPAAWVPAREKVRQPFDFMAASLRALGVAPEALAGMPPVFVMRQLLGGLRLMGQPFQHASGPNGWPEAAAAWIEPQTLAARIQWAMAVPGRIAPDLPDPRDFVTVALGDTAGAGVRAAARQAETRREGVGLVLASADFNRR